MSQTFVILFLSLWTITIGKPGLFDFIDNCESISDPSVCAILYDDENCNEGDWTPYRVKVKTYVNKVIVICIPLLNHKITVFDPLI